MRLPVDDTSAAGSLALTPIRIAFMLYGKKRSGSLFRSLKPERGLTMRGYYVLNRDRELKFTRRRPSGGDPSVVRSWETSDDMEAGAFWRIALEAYSLGTSFEEALAFARANDLSPESLKTFANRCGIAVDVIGGTFFASLITREGLKPSITRMNTAATMFEAIAGLLRPGIFAARAIA